MKICHIKMSRTNSMHKTFDFQVVHSHLNLRAQTNETMKV